MTQQTTTLREMVKEMWRKLRGEKNVPRKRTESEVDVARADWEGMGQARYTPPDGDETNSSPNAP